MFWRHTEKWSNALSYLEAVEAALRADQPDHAVALLADPPSALVEVADFGMPMRARLEAAVLEAARAERLARGEIRPDIAPADLPRVHALCERDTPDAAALLRAAAGSREPVLYLDFPDQQAGWRNLVLEIEALREMALDASVCMIFISGFSFFAQREFLLDRRLRLPPTAAARFLSDEFIHLAEARDPFRFAGSTLSMHLFEMYRYAWADQARATP
ncbi:MAG: hypothetical protein N2111_05910 [Candidatus Sumerlaeaceae bacterium]|nr:hypothetical protein [Candidatus Sumerlaeaceae bacterium]